MLYLIYYLVLGFALIGCAQADSADTNTLKDADTEYSNLFLGDPFILLDDGTYYAYGTGRSSDTGIEVYTSKDLKKWKGPVGTTDGLVLHEDDVYGEKSFWAPEVYKMDGRYYMFFSVEEHMAIAVSDSPEGPFKQEEPGVLRDHESIDHHLFVAEDGTKYLFFANFKQGLEIWGAELRDDFSSIKEETLTKLMEPSQEWEKSPKEPVGRVNEGPFVLQRNDKLYMTYSANHYASPDYGIGLASAEEPLGEWTKSDQNPVIQNPEGLVGTGHGMLFRDKKGSLNLVYHAHHDTSKVHPRKVYYNEVEFVDPDEDGGATLEVKSPRYEPKVVQPSE